MHRSNCVLFNHLIALARKARISGPRDKKEWAPVRRTGARVIAEGWIRQLISGGNWHAPVEQVVDTNTIWTLRLLEVKIAGE
jgi:hypothetical protein